MKDIFMYLFLVVLFVYGLYVASGAVRNRKSFLGMYKSIDLINLFGDFGRVLYALIGLAACAVAVLLFLKKLGIGPLVGQK